MHLRPILYGLLALTGTGLACASTNDPYADYADNSSYQPYTSSHQSYDSGSTAQPYPEYDPIDYDISGAGSSAANSNLFLPEQSTFEYLGPMKVNNGSGHATMTNWRSKFSLANAVSKSWRFNVDTEFTLSWFEGKRDAGMDVHRLYRIWFNFGATYNLWKSTYLTVGANPEFASDFDSWVARNFNIGGHVLLTSKLSDKFTLTGGVAFAPQLGDASLFPYIGFRWQASPSWTVEMQGVRLAAMNKVTDYFSWGPFVSIVAGSWVVKHDHSHARYEWMSGVAGIATETGLGKWGGIHPKLLADVGFSFASEAKFKTTNGRHDLEKKRYDPGFYLRVGLGFSF